MNRAARHNRLRRSLRLLVDYLVYLAARVMICIVQTAGLDACARGSRLLASVFSDWLRIRGRVVDENLLHAFPEKSDAERAAVRRGMWEHLCLLVVETAHAGRKIHDTNWRDYLMLSRPEMFVRAMLEDRPLVLLAGHYGNFELCNYMMGVLGFKTHAIVRPLDNVFLNSFLERFRGANGQQVIPKDGCAPLVDALMAKRGMLGFLVDTHAGPKGCHVEFFGRPVSTHKAIAVFAIGYQAPMIMCFSRRVGGPLRHFLGAHEIIDTQKLAGREATVPALTRWFTQQLETIVRQDPQQYWWLHRRWKDTREKKTRPDTAAKAAA